MVGSPCSRAGISRSAVAPPLLERDGRRDRRGRSPRNTALTTRCWFLRPSASSSPDVRSTSRSAARSGRVTSTMVVRSRVAQGLHRGGEPRLLHLQPRVWAEARGPLGGRLQEARPRARQAEEPQRVSGRRRVEEHVIEGHGSLRRPQEARRTRRTRRSPRCTRRRAARAARRSGSRSRWRGTARSRARGSRRPPSRDRC